MQYPPTPTSARGGRTLAPAASRATVQGSATPGAPYMAARDLPPTPYTTVSTQLPATPYMTTIPLPGMQPPTPCTCLLLLSAYTLMLILAFPKQTACSHLPLHQPGHEANWFSMLSFPRNTQHPSILICDIPSSTSALHLGSMCPC